MIPAGREDFPGPVETVRSAATRRSGKKTVFAGPFFLHFRMYLGSQRFDSAGTSIGGPSDHRKPNEHLEKLLQQKLNGAEK
jgi:hypothetical protein